MLRAAAVGECTPLAYHHLAHIDTVIHTYSDSCVLDERHRQYMVLTLRNRMGRVTYCCISTQAQNSLACCCCQRLSARYNAIATVNSASSTGKWSVVCVRPGVDCFCVE